MIDSVARMDDLLSATPTIETQYHPLPASMTMSVVGPAMSDAVTRPLSATSTNGRFDLFAEFVEHLAKTNSSPPRDKDYSRAPTIDSDLALEAMADCASIEQAIGRALVVADRMNRQLVVVDSSDGPNPSPIQDQDPFFSFSVVDSLPDFGDQSRYRSKLAKRVGRMLRTRRDIAAAVAS